MSRFDHLRAIGAAATRCSIAGVAGAIIDELTEGTVGTGILLTAPFAAGYTVFKDGPKNQPPARYILAAPILGGATASAAYFGTRTILGGLRTLYR